MEGLNPSPQERWRVPNPRPKSDGGSQTLAPRAREGLKPSPQERWRVPNPRPKSDGQSQTLAPRAMEPQGRPPRPTRASNLELEAGADVQGAEAREQGDGRRHEHERVLHQRHLRQPRQVLPPPLSPVRSGLRPPCPRVAGWLPLPAVMPGRAFATAAVHAGQGVSSRGAVRGRCGTRARNGAEAGPAPRGHVRTGTGRGGPAPTRWQRGGGRRGGGACGDVDAPRTAGG